MRKVDLVFLEAILAGATDSGFNVLGNANGGLASSLSSHTGPLSSSPTTTALGLFMSSPCFSKQTSFDVLYTTDGFRRVKEWFRQHATRTRRDWRGDHYRKNESDGKGDKNESEDEHDGVDDETDEGDKPYLSERQFVELLRRLADFNETEALEIFDIFERGTGRVEFEEFFLLLSALAARESAQMTQFLYLHGPEVFALLSDPLTNTLTFERFSKLGFFLGVPEELLLTRLNEHGAHAFHPLDAEAFTLFYFDVFSAIDNFRKKTKPTTPGVESLLEGGSGHSGKKSKDCLIS